MSPLSSNDSYKLNTPLFRIVPLHFFPLHQKAKFASLTDHSKDTTTFL